MARLVNRWEVDVGGMRQNVDSGTLAQMGRGVWRVTGDFEGEWKKEEMRGKMPF